MILMYLLFAIAALVLIYLVLTYNFFVSSRARVKASIQEIGNQLKRQADLIPNLESSVKGYLKHEKGIMQMLSEARMLVGKGKDASTKLSEVLPKLQILVESNPQLKADGVVIQLMDDLRDTSDKVMYARRLMIDLTADYNVKRVNFPSNLVANLFSFEELKGLETSEDGTHLKVSDSEMKSPQIDL